MAERQNVGPVVSLVVIVVLLSIGGVQSRNEATGGPCPTGCRCSPAIRHSPGAVFTDCSRAGLSSIPVTQMDPETVHLDMTNNRVRKISTDTFIDLGKLEVVLLSDNLISTLEENAFSGLNNLKTLDLKRNRLRILKKHSLARVSGHETECFNGTCVLDLSENNLEVIETNAVSWIKRLSVVVGHSDQPLTLQAYAFYGMQDIHTITLTDVPSLTLERHAITNAERVGSVQIMNTRLADIHNFTFQGLEDVGSIVIHNSELSQIKTLGFSAVRYDTSAKTTMLNPITGNKEVLSGGVFNMSYCQVTKLEKDLFKDTNLAHIFLTGNRIYEIEGQAFSGLDSLDTFYMVGNTMDTLSTESLGSLSGLQALILERNQIDVIQSGAFRGSRDIELFRLSLKLGSNLTLSSNAFSGVLGVSTFEMVGNPPVQATNSYAKTAVHIHPDAFHNFVADSIAIINVSLPTLRQNTFRGLSKVKTLTFVSCDVEEIEHGTFGASYGAVNDMVMTEGSQLTCDCTTYKLIAEFKQTFPTFHINCNTVPQPGTQDSAAVPSEEVALDTLDWTFCMGGLGVKPCADVALFSLTLALLITWLL